MSKTFAVIGLGLLGRTVCDVLTEKGGEVIAIDNNPSLVNKVKDYVSQAVLLDSTDEEALANAPFDQVDAAIVAIGDNIEASILTTTLLKQLGVPYIISRAVNRTHYQVLKQIGANEVFNVEEDQGTRIAQNLIAPSVLDKIKLSREIFMTEMYVPDMMVGTKVDPGEMNNRFRLQLSAVRRSLTELDADGNSHRQEKLLYPGAAGNYEAGDILICLGTEKDLDEFQKRGEN